MTHAEGEVLLAPAPSDGMKIGTADAAGMNLDIDIVFIEGFGLVVSSLELIPGLNTIDLEAIEGLWINHGI